MNRIVIDGNVANLARKLKSNSPVQLFNQLQTLQPYNITVYFPALIFLNTKIDPIKSAERRCMYVFYACGESNAFSLIRKKQITTRRR